MATEPLNPTGPQTSQLSRKQCFTILVVAFLGWMFAGVQMGINSIAYHPAASQLLGDGVDAADVGKWSGWLVVAFLLGAAAGGYAFGWIGDRFGRAKAMSLSIGCYSVFSYGSVFSQSVEVFWLFRFVTCMGIGGMWPNGMALLQEAWPNTAKPILAGILGTSANVGIMLFAILCMQVEVNSEAWRWTLYVGASPIVLAIAAWFLVPESPRWLEEQAASAAAEVPNHVGIGEVFSPPHLKLTSIGIILAFVPLFGGWGTSNWANYWAAEHDKKVTAEADVEEPSKPSGEVAKKTTSNLKAQTAFNRAWPGSISSLLGGALAFFIGRRLSYALLCVLAFTCTQFLFALPDPGDESFLFWVRGLGFFSGFFFGWLPLCLPEMFPTRVRSTGSGVSFNFGRIIVALLLILTSLALKEYFQGSYDTVGRVCGYMYLLGIVAVVLMPSEQKTTGLVSGPPPKH